ncbi:hypothetical protein B0A50_05954 [Salinomyces thailandicus]|uniref:Uncharacterized protein n=1 Tax=Salinomyces thailandicus TaxID=706561 RepID=A0A4U0TQ52_9PEZI|nr:hypothetical protein B0A50_05954 [Salinomyces thailandica]
MPPDKPKSALPCLQVLSKSYLQHPCSSDLKRSETGGILYQQQQQQQQQQQAGHAGPAERNPIQAPSPATLRQFTSAAGRRIFWNLSTQRLYCG